MSRSYSCAYALAIRKLRGRRAGHCGPVGPLKSRIPKQLREKRKQSEARIGNQSGLDNERVKVRVNGMKKMPQILTGLFLALLLTATTSAQFSSDNGDAERAREEARRAQQEAERAREEARRQQREAETRRMQEQQERFNREQERRNEEARRASDEQRRQTEEFHRENQRQAEETRRRMEQSQAESERRRMQDEIDRLRND